MLDRFIQPILQPPLIWTADRLLQWHLRPGHLSGLSIAFGFLSGMAVAMGWTNMALAVMLLGRLCDGIDGPMARQLSARHGSNIKRSAVGGFVDIVGDYVGYGALPFGFALMDPTQNSLPTAFLLWSFIMTAVSFLAHALLKKDLPHPQPTSHISQTFIEKSFHFSFGVVEGFETIVFFVLICLKPDAYALYAWIFGGLCMVTSALRFAYVLWHYRLN